MGLTRRTQWTRWLLREPRRVLALLDRADEHLFTLLGVVLVVLVLRQPEVGHILALPPSCPIAKASDETHLWLLHWAWLAGAAVFGLSTGFLAGTAPRGPRGLGERGTALFFLAFAPPVALRIHLEQAASARRWLPLFLLPAVATAVVVLTIAATDHRYIELRQSEMLIHTFAAAGTAAFVLGLLSLPDVTLDGRRATGSWLRRRSHALVERIRPSLRCVADALLFWLVGVCLLEGLWLVITTTGISWRTYSMGALVLVLTEVLIVLRWVDRTGSSLGRRVGAACGFVLFAVWLLSDSIPQVLDLTDEQDAEEFSLVRADDPPDRLTEEWLIAALRRLRAIPDGPVVLVAAEGGGSRAALLTGLVLEDLCRLEDADGVSLADRVLLLSSVSGGSLASGQFVAKGCESLTEVAGRDTVVLRNAYVGELLAARDPEGLEWSAETIPWPLRSKALDRLMADQLAPMFRGILLPGIARGEMLMWFWSGGSGALELEPSWLHEANGKSEPVRPLALLNSSLVTSGQRVVGGVPPVGPALLERAEFGPMVPPVLAISGGGDRAPRLPELVRASSAFPFGLDLPALRSHLSTALALCAEDTFGETSGAPPGPRGQSPALQSEACVVEVLGSRVPSATAAHHAHLVDGGTTDNSGLLALAAVLRGVARLSAESNDGNEPFVAPDRMRGIAAQLHEELLARKHLILLEIDGGARPAPEDVASDWDPRSARSAIAISQAAYARERTLNALNTSSIRASLGDQNLQVIRVSNEPAIPPPWTGRARLERASPWWKGEKGYVPTSWTLSPQQKLRVLEIYECQRRLSLFPGLQAAELVEDVPDLRWQLDERACGFGAPGPSSSSPREDGPAPE